MDKPEITKVFITSLCVLRIDVLNVYSFYYVMKGRMKMGSKEFIEKCKEIVKQYAMEHLDKSDNVPEFDVFDVWYCKTLQNHKALLSTTLFDGMYYELTYNGDKKELYFDAYKKFENKCIKLDKISYYQYTRYLII